MGLNNNKVIPIYQFTNEELNKFKFIKKEPNSNIEKKIQIAKNKLSKCDKGSLMEIFWKNQIKVLEVK